MFDKYAEKLKKVQADVPAIFKKVAGKAAIKFVNTAKKLTDDEGLVDTGNYRRNWNAQRIEPQVDTYGVFCQNSADYASHLEYGHKLKNGKMWKGRFVGQRTLDETHFYCLEQLDDELDKAFTSYHRSFVKPEE